MPNTPELSVVTPEDFVEILREGLGNQYDRAKKVFDNYGPGLSYDITNVLLHARDQSSAKVEEVLSILENHFSEELLYQHPEVRGTIAKCGINLTQVMFIDLCKNTLALQPTP